MINEDTFDDEPIIAQPVVLIIPSHDHARFSQNPDTPSIKIFVHPDAYGASLCVLDDHGHGMTEVAVEYYDNQIRLLVFRDDQEEPEHSLILVENVDKRRGKNG